MSDSSEGEPRAPGSRDPAHGAAGIAARIAAEVRRGSGVPSTDPFAAAVRATRMPMIITDARQADNPVIFANDAFCDLTGYTRREIVGRNCRFLQGPETDRAMVARIREAVRAGRAIELDLRNHRKDGEPFWNRLLMAPVRDEAGEVAYFFASQVDVTLERQRLLGLENDNAALTAELGHQLRLQRESEARLRFATEAGRLGVWELDLGGETLIASPMLNEVFGFERSATITYDHVRRVIHPDDRERVRDALANALRTGADYDIEYRVLRPGGEVGWVQIRAQLLRGPEGTPLRLAGVALDVTNRRAAELRLELSEQSLRMATEAAEIGTWDLDLGSATLTWSDRTRAMFGIGPEDACSMADFYAALHPDDLDSTCAAFAAALDPAIRSTYDVEYRIIRRRDGALRWVAAKGRALFDGERCVRALGTAIDITGRKRAEARQAFLLALGDRLRDLADDPVAMMTASTEALARRLGAPRVGYVGVDEAMAFATMGLTWNDAARVAELAARRCRLESFGVPQLPELQAGRTVRLDAPGARATLAAPVQRNGRTVAFVFVHDDTLRRWRDGDAELTREVADRTWAAVERARAQAALRELNATLEERIAERTAERDRMWRLSTSIMLVARHDGTITAVNPAWNTLLGWHEEELIDASFLTFVHPDDIAPTRAEMGRLDSGLTTLLFENRYRHRDGSYRWLSWTAVPDHRFIHAVARDVTAEKAAAEALARTEAQLRQAQKMEAVGQLTGGIAHDFNNLLTGVIGALELLQRRLGEGRLGDLDRYVEVAASSAARAATLTQRLLAFARRQPLDPRPVEANRLIGGMEELLRRTLGPSIDLELDLADGLWPILCDPNQLENAILNLAINARDAMPDGGRLSIETANIRLDTADAAALGGEVRAGEHVEIRIADSGVGMDAETRTRAFEPFFTTKPIGQGTGLGLSMLYGFVTQSGGHVRIESEAAEGTLFRLVLPRHHGAAGAPPDAAPDRASAPQARTGARVLVVEDEPAVRMLILDVLEDLGCIAACAEDGASGLRMLQSDPALDLLITDVGLPSGMNGRQLADAARHLCPALPVLFVTGFAGHAATGTQALGAGMQMLTKPFAMEALAAKVRGMLEPGACP